MFFQLPDGISHLKPAVNSNKCNDCCNCIAIFYIQIMPKLLAPAKLTDIDN